jgi:hypothetical protein
MRRGKWGFIFEEQHVSIASFSIEFGETVSRPSSSSQSHPPNRETPISAMTGTE